MQYHNNAIGSGHQHKYVLYVLGPDPVATSTDALYLHSHYRCWLFMATLNSS